jgi:hypothetical protein
MRSISFLSATAKLFQVQNESNYFKEAALTIRQLGKYRLWKK